MKRVAKIALFKNNKILLELRDDKPDILFPNHWTLVGGGIANGESAEDAVKREVSEELNYELNEAEFISTCVSHDESPPAEINLFFGKINCEIEDLELKEGQEIRFFSFDQLGSLKITPLVRKIIEKWQDYI